MTRVHIPEPFLPLLPGLGEKRLAHFGLSDPKTTPFLLERLASAVGAEELTHLEALEALKGVEPRRLLVEEGRDKEGRRGFPSRGSWPPPTPTTGA